MKQVSNKEYERYGVEALPDCLEQNGQEGIVCYREGFMGDYDEFDDLEELIEFIKKGTNDKYVGI